MYYGEIYNYGTGDNFVTFGKTETEVKIKLTKAYCDRYQMNDIDAHDRGYKSMEEYIEVNMGFNVLECITGGVYINNRFRKEN